MTHIYLDYNASTPVDPAVVAVMQPLLANGFDNPSSGHWASTSAKAALERGRSVEPNEIVFTGGLRSRFGSAKRDDDCLD